MYDLDDATRSYDVTIHFVFFSCYYEIAFYHDEYHRSFLIRTRVV